MDLFMHFCDHHQVQCLTSMLAALSPFLIFPCMLWGKTNASRISCSSCWGPIILANECVFCLYDNFRHAWLGGQGDIPTGSSNLNFYFDQMIWIKATCMNVKSCPINFECMMLPGSRGAIWKCCFQGQLVLFGIHACLNAQSWAIRMTWMTESITCTMWQDTESERKEQEAMNDFRLI